MKSFPWKACLVALAGTFLQAQDYNQWGMQLVYAKGFAMSGSQAFLNNDYAPSYLGGGFQKAWDFSASGKHLVRCGFEFLQKHGDMPHYTDYELKYTNLHLDYLFFPGEQATGFYMGAGACLLSGDTIYGLPSFTEGGSWKAKAQVQSQMKPFAMVGTNLSRHFGFEVRYQFMTIREEDTLAGKTTAFDLKGDTVQFLINYRF